MSKVLIVDDEKDMCWSLSKFLELNGYNTIAVQEGDSALDKVKTEELNLVLLDMQMPKKDGLKILQEIKNVRDNLPVVLITGYGNPEVAAKAIQLGASDYLSKPFDNRSLLDIVRKNVAVSNSGYKIHHGPSDPRPAPEDAITVQAESLSPSPESAGNNPVTIKITVWQVALGIMLLFGGLFYWSDHQYFSQLLETRTDRFTLDYSHPSAMARNRSSHWIADWYSQKIHLHHPDNFGIKKSFSLQGVRPSGMAWVGDDLYVSDSWKKRYYLFKFDSKNNTLELVRSWPSKGPKPTGLCWDGSSLWSSDLDTRKVYRHKLDDQLTVTAEYAYAGNKPIALSWDGKNLWSMDGQDENLYKHNSDPNLSIASRYSIKKNFPKLKNPFDFSVSRDSMWILSEDPPAIVRRRIPFQFGSYIHSLKREKTTSNWLLPWRNDRIFNTGD